MVEAGELERKFSFPIPVVFMDSSCDAPKVYR